MQSEPVKTNHLTFDLKTKFRSALYSLLIFNVPLMTIEEIWTICVSISLTKHYVTNPLSLWS